MKQKIKYLLFALFYLSIPYFIYELVITNFNWIFISLLSILILFTVMSIIINDDFKCVIFSPRLGKRIVHKSGIYYIKYTGSYYVLYGDNYFFKYLLDKFDPDKINQPSDILEKVKKLLDTLHAEKVKKYNKLKILQDWDGYTSLDDRRDDKINQIL